MGTIFIFFSELPGRSNVICFNDMVSYIIDTMKKQSVQTPQDIIIAAAKIIKSEIREMSKNIEEYPSVPTLQDKTSCKM